MSFATDFQTDHHASVIHINRDAGEKRAAMAGHVMLGAGDPDDPRQMRFRASTPALDRHGTIVRTEGIDTANFARNPVFGWGHDVYSDSDIKKRIGKVIAWEQDASRFDITVQFHPEGVNEIADDAVTYLRSGFLSMVSIGFYAVDAGWETLGGEEIYVYRKSELLEVSLVHIPANPEAQLISHALGKHSRRTSPGDHRQTLEVLQSMTAELESAQQMRAWVKEYGHG